MENAKCNDMISCCEFGREIKRERVHGTLSRVVFVIFRKKDYFFWFSSFLLFFTTI